MGIATKIRPMLKLAGVSDFSLRINREDHTVTLYFTYQGEPQSRQISFDDIEAEFAPEGDTQAAQTAESDAGG